MVIFGLAQGLLYPTMNALVADWSSAGQHRAYAVAVQRVVQPGNRDRARSSSALSRSTTATRSMFLVTLAITFVGLAIFLAGPTDTAPT